MLKTYTPNRISIAIFQWDTLLTDIAYASHAYSLDKLFISCFSKTHRPTLYILLYLSQWPQRYTKTALSMLMGNCTNSFVIK